MVISSLAISTTFISRTEGRNVKQTSKVWLRRLGSSQRRTLEDPEVTKRKLEKSKAIVSNMKRETIMVVSYNIFANSLASGTIPWVLSVKKDLVLRADEYFRASELKYSCWKDFKKNVLTPAYTRHFHKPRERRDLWRQGKLSSAEEIPKSCSGQLEFVDSDSVSYVASDGSRRIARTLRGTLRDNLPKALADEIFHDIMKNENDVYAWSSRGRKMMNLLTKRPWTVRYSGSGDMTAELNYPDIICLQEYDVHDTRIDEKSPSFQEEMRLQGYDGIFLHGPSRHSKSGLSIWWRSDRFDLDTEEDCEENETSVAYFQSCKISPVVQCRERTYCVDSKKRLAVWNSDLMETWSQSTETMPKSYRRNAALIRLRSRAHKEKTLYVGNVHLMTTSRDHIEKGDVRAGELRRVKDLCTEHVKSEEALILCGDFNTSCSRLDIFSGSSAGIETNFNVNTKAFEWWEDESLVEAFESHHEWSDENLAHRCTSKNKNRTEWIDYMFYTPNSLRVIAKTDNYTPAHSIPDASEDYPSDHMPIGVLFEL